MDNYGKTAGESVRAAELLLRFDAYLRHDPGSAALANKRDYRNNPGDNPVPRQHDRSGAEAVASPLSASPALGNAPGAVLLDEEAVEAVLRRAASVLLSAPGARFYERLPVVRRALLELPAIAARRALAGFCDYAAAEPEHGLRAHHARTFDAARRRTLHLLDHDGSDTRRRRRLRARIAHAYADCGCRSQSVERPDHLAVVLEFAARVDSRIGERLLVRLQPGLERLRSALSEHGTPYAAVLDAVCATLPPPARPGPGRLAANGRAAGAGVSVPAVPVQAGEPDPDRSAARTPLPGR